MGETNCANCNNEQISPTQSQLMAALNLGVPSFGGGGSFNTKPDKKPVKVCFWAPKFTCTPDPSSPWGVDKCTSEIVEICIEV